MQKVEDWINTKEFKELKKIPIDEYLSLHFLRDPARAVYTRKDVFYSPCDGVILYTYDNISPSKSLIEIKGKNYTVKEILVDKSYDENSLVIGIFLTFFDCHIIRIPTRGKIKIKNVDPIYSYNLSMRLVENNLLTLINPKNRNIRDEMGYLFTNERDIVEVYNPDYRIKYYIVEIADLEVDANLFFCDEQGDFLDQGERLSVIRYGSQCELVIPLNQNKNINYEILAKPFFHVEAGLDAVIKIKERE